MKTQLSKVSTQANILIVDDIQKILDGLKLGLELRGYKVFTAENISTGWKIFTEEDIDIALLDIRIKKENGLDLLKKIHSANPEIPVIMFTGYGTIDTAVKAIKSGAYSYLQKPIKIEQLSVSIQNAITMSLLKEENRKLLGKNKKDKQLIYESEIISKLVKKTIKLAKTDLSILIEGESGTGKELLAELIHKNSSRKDKPLIKFNCASFSDSLLNDELFGHVKGAFTGAAQNHEGLFERADGGTLFLDEIGEMKIETQAKILRAIQNQEISRLGDSKTIKLDIRFIAATNINLEKAVTEGKFRKDLYFRLNMIYLKMPPLREHPTDIPALCRYYLAKQKTVPFTISKECVEILNNYEWPGNIRELANTIQYAAAIAIDYTIEVEDLPNRIIENSDIQKESTTREQMEQKLILSTLKENNFNKSKVAKILGYSRATIYNKIKQYGIKDE